jgi:hypothetical protein
MANHDDKLDPRTQTKDQSPDAKKSMANKGKVPPSIVDSKVGVEDHEPGGQTVDRDVDKGNPTPTSGDPNPHKKGTVTP